MTGGATQATAQFASDQLDRFYSHQLAIAQSEAADLREAIANPGGDDGTALEFDDIEAAQTRSEQLDRMATALSQRQPYITGVVADITLAQLTTILALPGSVLKTVATGSLGDPTDAAGVLNHVLDNSSTDAEIAAWRAHAPAQHSGPTGTSASSATTSAAPGTIDIIAGKTCGDLDERVKSLNIPDSFIPNRESARVLVQQNGNKISQLRMRWTLPGALRWFCGAPKAKRGFEPDSKPRDNGIVNGWRASALVRQLDRRRLDEHSSKTVQGRFGMWEAG